MAFPDAPSRFQRLTMRAHGIARLLLILSLSASAFAGTASANPAGGSVSRVRVLHHVDWIAATRYTATVMITNMTTAPIDRWTLEFDLFPVADVIDNVAWSIDGTRHTVRGTGPMKSIEPGQMVWFTYEAEWDGNGVSMPAVCRFNGEGCTFEPVLPPPANPQTELPVEVVYWVSWKGLTQYRAQIWIHNTSDAAIDYWTMGFSSDAVITSVDHVAWSANGKNHSVAGTGWTRRIEPDEAVWFTLEGVHYGEVARPSACVFNGFACEFLGPEDIVPDDEDPDVPFAGYCKTTEQDVPSATASDVSVSFKWNSLWDTGYVAAVQITNLATDRPIRNWKLVFDLASTMTVSQFWNGDLTRTGNRFTVSSLLYNNCVEPGASVSFGFEGSHTGSPTRPTFCEFGGAACAFSARFASTDVEDPDPVSTSGFAIEAVYPNPFSDRVAIPIRTDRTQRIQLTVWDLQGRRVASLFDRTMGAGERDLVTLDGHDLAPGAYLVRMTGAKGVSVSKPLVLLR